MIGYKVNKELLDVRSAEAVIAVRDAFEKVERVKNYLANLPQDEDGVDPLVRPVTENGKFGYSADEAYLLRVVFDELSALNIDPTLEKGQKLTGLE